MKHNLFLVHGMGVHETDSWSNEVKDKLKEVADRYEFFQDKNLDDHINYFPISYDEKLKELLNLWKENAAEMSNFLAGQDLDEDLGIPEILGWFENADETQKNFFWSHIADVLIYRFFVTYQADIRADVALQFVEAINWITDNNEGNYFSTVVTHSLGNIVAHDALHMLGTNMFSEHRAFEPEDWRFQILFSLANVSRVMKTDFDPYNSIIRPECAGGPAYFYEHFNTHHKLDPFTRVQCFSPENWGDEYYSIELDHFHDWNIHGFDHYLDHPKVHIPLLKSIFSLDCISNEETTNAYEAYNGSQRFGGNLKCIGDIKNIVDTELKPLVDDINSSASLKDFIPTLLETYSIYEKIKKTVEACDE